MYSHSCRVRKARRPAPLAVHHDNIYLLPIHRAVYFAIPKNASTTLKTMISILSGVDALPNGHMRLTISRKSALTKYSRYLKFAFTRDPFDRLVSCYRFKIIEEGSIPFKRYGDMFSKGMSFPDFVAAVCEIPDREANRHFRSQSSFLTDAQGSLVIDFIGRVENFETDCSRLSRLLGEDLPAVAKRKVSKSPRPSQGCFTAELRDKVGQRYESDFTLLGYPFDPDVPSAE